MGTRRYEEDGGVGAGGWGGACAELDGGEEGEGEGCGNGGLRGCVRAW